MSGPPASRLGQAFVSCGGGQLVLVVSDPYQGWSTWAHDLVAFPSGDRFGRAEEVVAELDDPRSGWTRLA